jgi:exonuclease III
LSSKLDSFENLLVKENPSIFCLQETKMKRPNQIKTSSAKNYTMYELLRKNSGGGGLCVGVHRDLQPVWIAQGDDEVECLVVEVWLNDFPIRIINGYGPQGNDKIERKQKFWDFLEREVCNAIVAGAGLVLQMDGNCHLGTELLKEDINA